MRQGIFTDKAGGDRIQGIITKIGSQKFESARRKLAKLAGWQPEDVSDGDTVEALSRGWTDTAAYLKERNGR